MGSERDGFREDEILEGKRGVVSNGVMGFVSGDELEEKTFCHLREDLVDR